METDSESGTDHENGSPDGMVDGFAVEVRVGAARERPAGRPRRWVPEESDGWGGSGGKTRCGVGRHLGSALFAFFVVNVVRESSPLCTLFLIFLCRQLLEFLIF